MRKLKLEELPDRLAADGLEPVALDTIRDWIKQGKLPALRFGRRLYVTEDAWLAFLAAKLQPA